MHILRLLYKQIFETSKALEANIKGWPYFLESAWRLYFMYNSDKSFFCRMNICIRHDFASTAIKIFNIVILFKHASMKLLSSVSDLKSSNPWQAGGMFQLLIDWSREKTFVVIIQFKFQQWKRHIIRQTL